TPLRPNEASGTSGMKAAANGVLNLSVPDGWWDEVWNDPQNSRQMGWAIGKGEDYSDRQYQDQVEAQALYDLLERDVIPTFYDRGPDRIPRKWAERMKTSISSLCPFVNTHRMVRDYTCEYYTAAHERFRALEANGAARARELAAAMNRIRTEWHNVWIGAVEDGPENNVPVASTIRVHARVHLGRLTPQDVEVDLYLGRVAPEGELVESRVVPLQAEGKDAEGAYHYVGATAVGHSGLHGFTLRVRPSHPDLSVAFVPGLICWAEEAGTAPAVG
ncbi:MAG TPA: hypothetical protein VKG25_24245, partial [Bryobacteraceae bacterium]|nr:hypothetical protein [Bryobacteraceae bacterium]